MKQSNKVLLSVLTLLTIACFYSMIAELCAVGLILGIFTAIGWDIELNK